MSASVGNATGAAAGAALADGFGVVIGRGRAPVMTTGTGTVEGVALTIGSAAGALSIGAALVAATAGGVVATSAMVVAVGALGEVVYAA